MILHIQRPNNLLRQSMNNILWVRRSQIQQDMCCASFNIRAHTSGSLSQVVIVGQPLNGSFNFGGIASDGSAVLVQDLALVAEVFNGASNEVPYAGVLSYDTEG